MGALFIERQVGMKIKGEGHNPKNALIIVACLFFSLIFVLFTCARLCGDLVFRVISLCMRAPLRDLVGLPIKISRNIYG
jgi:hypothetical protein